MNSLPRNIQVAIDFLGRSQSKEKQKKLFLNIKQLTSNYSSINMIRFNSISKGALTQNHQLQVKL